MSAVMLAVIPVQVVGTIRLIGSSARTAFSRVASSSNDLRSGEPTDKKIKNSYTAPRYDSPAFDVELSLGAST